MATQRLPVPGHPDPRPARPDPDMLTGPSPAFEASLLEVERDFRFVLARIEATRAKAEGDRVWGRPAPPSPAPTDPPDA